MDTTLYRLEVIQGKEEKAQEWLTFLADNKEHALKTLIKEDVYFESYFKEIIDGTTFIYLLILCKDLAAANAVAMQSTEEVDVKHFAYMKECINLEAGNIMHSELSLSTLSELP